MKFSPDDLDTITDLMDSVYWPVVEKVLEAGVQEQRERVLSADISESTRALFLAKARADGAQALASYVGSLKRKVEKKRNG